LIGFAITAVSGFTVYVVLAKSMLRQSEINFITKEHHVEVDQEQYDKIAQQIHCDSSPVGIDAKKTHILILQLLTDIDARLKRLEARFESN